MFQQIEAQVRHWVEWLRLFVEALGVLIIAVGLAIAILGLIRHAFVERGKDFTPVRLTFARYLALALELQLAADILSTAVAPTWDRIGKLAVIAAIRTALNYFIRLEIKEESAHQEAAGGRRPEQGG